MFILFQVLAALAVSLGPFAAGLGKGYTSPAMDSLQGNGTLGSLAPQGAGLTITDQEASWIASLSLLGECTYCDQLLLF